MAQTIQTQAFLANLPLFNELAPAELDRLAAATTVLRVARGSTVFRKGDPCLGMHVVVYGQVKLSLVTPQGHEKVVELIGPGFSFGEALMFMGKPYIVTATALADSMILHVAHSAIEDELAREPGFARKMLAGLSRKLHALVGDLESVTLKSGLQRVVGYLLRVDAAGDEIDPAPYTVALPVSKAIVASRLNLTPEHFSRILQQLTGAGLIEVSGRDVTVLDPLRLRGYEG